MLSLEMTDEKKKLFFRKYEPPIWGRWFVLVPVLSIGMLVAGLILPFSWKKIIFGELPSFLLDVDRGYVESDIIIYIRIFSIIACIACCLVAGHLRMKFPIKGMAFMKSWKIILKAFWPHFVCYVLYAGLIYVSESASAKGNIFWLNTNGKWTGFSLFLEFGSWYILTSMFLAGVFRRYGQSLRSAAIVGVLSCSFLVLGFYVVQIPWAMIMDNSTSLYSVAPWYLTVPSEIIVCTILIRLCLMKKNPDKRPS